MKNNNKTKVAIVINSLNIGGAERLVVDQLKFFDRTQFDITLITLFEYPTLPDFYSEVPNDIPIHRLDFKAFTDIRSWYKLLKILRQFKTDVTISHLFFANTVTRVLKLLLGYMSIIVEHNTYTNKTKAQILTDRILSALTYKIVAVSKTVAEFTSKQEHISPNKFQVIHNGVDIDKINKEISKLPTKDILKKQLGFSDLDRLIINVARLTPQKNQKLLIESFAEFVKSHKEYKLVILGEGGIRDELEELANKLGLREKVFLPGLKSPYPYYVASDFMVLTSRIEGFAITGIEAMACGIPVVSTKTAGPDEYIKEGANGFLVNSNIVSVCEGMEKALQFGDKAKNECKKTSKIYSIQGNSRKYENLFLTQKNTSVAIITFATLGDKRNLKTSDILPAIESLDKEGVLQQVICYNHSNFSFKDTVNAIPFIIRAYFVLIGKLTSRLASRRNVERVFDYMASRKIKDTRIVIFHDGRFLPKTAKRARENGSIIIDLAVTAHPKTNASLEREEASILGISEYQGWYTKIVNETSHLNDFDYIIGISDFVKKTYIDSGFSADRIYVAYPDVDISRFKADGKRNDKFVVLYVADTQMLKGLHYLLEAWEGINLKDAELWIVGNITGPKKLIDIYNKSFSNNQDIKHFEHSATPESYYKEASVFVFPSLSEGFGKVTLEAMACKLPVITTENARGLIENCRNGFVLPIRNPEDIKDKIEYLYNNADIRNKMGEEARKTILQKEPFGEKIMKIYYEILKIEK